MLVLLSPAKTLDESIIETGCKLSEPVFASQTHELVSLLQSLSKPDLKQTLAVSANLASLNFSRYQQWSQHVSKPAGFAFDGPAYKALSLTSLDKAEIMHCQQHLRVVDGLYGLLRPLDSIKPYRLEMANKLNTSKGKTLYAYWGDLLTDALNREIAQAGPGSQFIVNCASQEYFKAINTAKLDYPVYHTHFPGPSVYAKAARGAMVRFIVQNRVTSPEQLKAFTGSDGEWSFDAEHSEDLKVTFTRSKSTQKRAAAGSEPPCRSVPVGKPTRAGKAVPDIGDNGKPPAKKGKSRG